MAWLGRHTGSCGALREEDLVDRLIGTGTLLALTTAVALLMIAFDWGWGQRLAGRGTAWLRSFGRMSYEIYLTHMFVVLPTIFTFRLSGGAFRYGWAWYIPALGLSWGLGWCVDRLLSRPADRWVRGKLRVAGKVAQRHP